MWKYSPIPAKDKLDVVGAGYLYGPVFRLFVDRFDYDVHEEQITHLGLEYDESIDFDVIEEDKILITMPYISFVADYDESFQETVEEMIKLLGPKRASKMRPSSQEKREEKRKRLYKTLKEIEERK